MPRLPAVCTECELIYPSPLRAGRADSDVAFAVPVRCPACGSGGRVPAEVLQRLVEAVGVLRELGPGPGELEEDLQEVAAVCREANDREGAVLDVLRRVPRVGRLAGLLPGETPSQMATFTRVLAAVGRELAADGEAGSGGPADAGGGPPPPEGEPEPPLEVVSRALEGLYGEVAVEEEAGPPDEEERARSRLRRTGRNDPCPCGSGDKYKDCHWVEDQRTTRV